MTGAFVIGLGLGREVVDEESDTEAVGGITTGVLPF